MLIKLLIIFGAIACGSAAPSCIDLCGPGSVNTQASESLTAFRTHSSVGQQQETLRDLHQSLTDQLQSSQINVDFDRPGNWTDHKDYRTPDGAGEVHEEAGQLVNGGAKVRYYKKKYAASYGSGSANNLGLGDALESDSLLRGDLLNSRSTVGHTDVHSYGHRAYDERRQDSSRFQDLETTGTQLHDNTRVTGAANTGDWSRHDTYGVDGGRGRVYEEEGQYSQGPAKVRYYKKNYTSSYSTNGAPGIIPLTGVADLETQARQLESQLSQLSRDLQHTQVSQSQNIHKDSLHRDTTARQSEYGRVYNDNDYSQHYDRPVAATEQRYEHSSRKESTVRSGGSYAPVQPVSSFNYAVPDTVGAQTHRTEHTQHTQQTHAYTPTQVVQTHQTHVPVQPVTHFSYVVPDTELEAVGSQTQRTEHTQHIQQTHQTHVPIQPVTHFNYVVPDIELEAVGSQSQRTEHTQHTQQTHQTHGYVPSQVVQTHQTHQETDGIARVPLHRVNNYGGSTYGDESRRQELVSEGQTSHHQLRDDAQYVYSQPELSRVVQTHPGKRVEEHWSSSSRHRVESTIPHHIDTVPIIDVGISHQKISQHNGGLHSGYADGLNQAANTRVSGGSSSSYHHEEFGTGGGSYHVGAVHVGHQAADCDTEGQQSSGYTRRYKRGVEFGQQTENLNRIQGQGQWGQVQGHQRQDYDHHSHPHQDDDRHRHSGQDYDHGNGGGYQHQSHEGHPHQDDDRHRHSGQDYDHRNGGGYQHQSHEGHPHQDDDRHRHSGQDYDHGNGGGYQHQSHEGHPHQDDDRHRHSGQDYDHGNGGGYQHQSHEGHPHQDDDRNRHPQQDYLRYKREQSPQQYEDLNQHSEIGFGDLTHHQSGDFDFGQQRVENLELESQKTEDLHQQTQGFDLWDKQSGNLELGQQTEDLSQQAHHFDDFSQHSGNYDFGKHHLSGDLELGQQTEDFSQQAHKFDDFTQQQAGKLELGQHHYQHLGGLEFGQQTEDVSQQTHQFDDITQQQAGKLEFGQHHHQQHTGSLDFGQQTEDLSQQTQQFGDFSQHTSDLEFGQHEKQNLEGLELGQQTEDLSQQTDKFDDFSQHQSGKLEFGQHHQQHTGNLDFGQQTEDLSQQTQKFGDLSQHTSDLEFGQHEKQHLGLELGQQTEDLSQQTDKFDDFSQHQSGKLEFGQHHQQHTGSFDFGQQTEDFSQQSHKFDDFTQQQAGKLEFGQHHHQQHTGSLEFGQQTEDFSQQSHKFDDFSQHQSGKLEFGQHHQQHTGSLELGQETEDLSQHTHKFDDFNQHTSDLEFGQQHLGGLELGQQTEDLSQQTHKFDDFTQQQAGKLEFGQHHHQQHTGSLEFGQQTEDFSQQSHKFDDFSQHQSGKLEFGQYHQQHTGSLELGQETEDLSQHTHKFDDFNQHTSDLEFGQQHLGGLELGQQTEDLSQQTHKFDDFTQQQAGKLEFGQHHQQHTGSLEFGQQTDDLSQQTHKFDEFSQHSGDPDFGQQHLGGLEFGQQTEDLSQQTHKFDDFSQHQSGNFEFGQEHTGKFEFGKETQETSQLGFDKPNQQTTGFSPSTNYPREFKPAPKPTPRSQRIGNPSRGDIESVTVPGGPVGPIGPVNVPVRPVKGGRGFKPLGASAQYRNDVPSEGVLSLEEQSFQSPDSGNLWHQSHHPVDLTSDHPQGQHSQIDGVTFQPRILEAYGGKGPYEAGHQEDIFSGIKPNPSATLAPQSHGNDPWEIREASEQFSSHRIPSLDTVPESTTQSPETTPAPGFWKKLGNKITNSYEKAKEKLSDTFG